MVARIFLDSRAAKGEAPLKIAIAHEKKTAYIPLGVKILPHQWDKDSQSIKDHPKRKELNLFLRNRLSCVETEMLRLQAIGETKGKSVNEIRDMIDFSLNPEKRARKEKEGTFLARFIRYRNLQNKPKSISAFDWTLKWLRDFDKKLDSRTFDDITTDYLKDFLAHCHELSINSRAILLRNIRTVFNDAIDAGITQNYPFRRLSIKTEKTRKKALTIEQMRTLSHFPCNAWGIEYRDMFMLMFYLRGINAVDLFSARLTQVVNGRLEYRRSKVGSLFSVKIEPEAWEIINRYKGKEYLLNVLERYSSYSDYLHHMDDALKKIGCERGKKGQILGEGLFPGLSSNWARHSWATIGINLGISKEVISRGMGHSFGVSVTEVYIDFDMKAVDNANRKIIDAMKK